MESKLLIETYSYNDNFNSDKDLDSNSYIEMLKKYSTIEDDVFEVEKIEQDKKYVSCSCEVYDSNLHKMDLNDLASKTKDKFGTVLNVKLDEINSDIEFLEEWGNWYVETNHILSKVKINVNDSIDVKKMVTTQRDLKLEIKNINNEIVIFTLNNVTLLGKNEGNFYKILVDEINFD